VFQFNSDSCHYPKSYRSSRVRGTPWVTSTERQQLRQHLIDPDIFVPKSAAFSTKYLDIYDKYVLPATEGNIDVARRWHDAPMDFWQNLLNFATWCTTTGCGVSVHDHLKGRYDFAPESAQLSMSIFRFHVYTRLGGSFIS